MDFFEWLGMSKEEEEQFPIPRGFYINDQPSEWGMKAAEDLQRNLNPRQHPGAGTGGLMDGES